MSETNPTPLQDEPIPVAALPVEPLPAAQSYYPTYRGDFARASRPGIISAIGISSIIIASICILAGCIMMLMNTVVSSMARRPTPAALAPAVVAAAGPAELLGPNGTASADRSVIIEGLEHVEALTDLEKQQLDELLAEEGKSVLPLSGPNLTPEQVAANVTRGGHLSTGGSAGTEYFDLGNGRLELTEERAVFFPTGGQPAIRANAITVPMANGGTLQPEQIRSVLRAINRANNGNIKSAQATAIVQMLQNPGQQLIVPTTDGSDPAGEVVSADTDPNDGSLSLATHHGTTDSTIVLDTSGSNTSTSSASMNTFSSANTFNARGPVITFNRSASQWVGFLSVVELGLAIYLLICGIFTLRQSSFLGRRMHWFYVGIKLPIAIATGAACYWLWNGFFTAQAAGNPGAAPAPAAALWFAMPALVGMIYPIVLLFVLSTHAGVRSYFSAARYTA